MAKAMKIDFPQKAISPQEAYFEMLGGGSQGERIIMIPINRLSEFPNQPFKPYTENRLRELAIDIAENGILSPLCVRPMGDGWQILAGHNRRNAAALAGWTEVPCIVKEVDNDTAALIVVNTNLNQREELSLKEKAFAYKMQMEAIKQQGKRTDLMSGTMCHKLSSATTIGQISGESERNIRNYIRLTYLVPTLLNMVDNKLIPFRAGVNLSYLSPEQQDILFSFMEENEIKSVSLKQSEAIKGLSDVTEESLKPVFGLVPKQESSKGKIGAASKKVLEQYFKNSHYDDLEIAAILQEALESFCKDID